MNSVFVLSLFLEFRFVPQANSFTIWLPKFAGFGAHINELTYGIIALIGAKFGAVFSFVDRRAKNLPHFGPIYFFDKCSLGYITVSGYKLHNMYSIQLSIVISIKKMQFIYRSYVPSWW